MTSPLRTSALATLQQLRQSSLRRPILKSLVWLHNTSYHAISFFSSHSGLHPKHAILNYHQFFVDRVNATDRVLDVGSGNGAVAFDVAQKAKQVVGIDIRPRNVASATEKYQRANLRFIQGDAVAHAFSEAFDVIILSNVLEHIEHRVEFLQKLSAIAPRLLIRVPLLSRDWISVYKKQQGFEYRLDDTHFIEYTEENFRQEMQEAGLVVQYLHTAFGELYADVRRRV